MLLSICLDSAFPASTYVCIFIPAGTHATVHAQNAKMKRAETQEWNVYMRVLFQSNWAYTVPFLFVIFFFFWEELVLVPVINPEASSILKKKKT